MIEQFFHAVLNNDIEELKSLLNNGVFPNPKENGQILSKASELGYINIVNLLLDCNDIKFTNNCNDALGSACYTGNFEIIKILLKDKRFNAHSNNSYAIKVSSIRGFFDITQLLLQYNKIDPSHDSNMSINCAYERDHFNIVNLLWKDNRVKNTLQQDNANLYNQLIKKEVQNKVNKF